MMKRENQVSWHRLVMFTLNKGGEKERGSRLRTGIPFLSGVLCFFF